MVQLTFDDLRDLSREELTDLVLRLTEQVQQLQAEVAELRKPPANSRNSSQPPSRDWKANRTSGQRRKKRGAKVGHVKADRPLVDNPDQIIPAKVTICNKCGTELSQVEPAQTLRRQVTELPEIKPVVIETRQDVVAICHRSVACTGCIGWCRCKFTE